MLLKIYQLKLHLKLLQTKPMNHKEIIYTPEVQHSPWKMMVGRLLSFWDGKISGATLNFQGVLYIYILYYIYREPASPLIWGFNPRKEGPFHSKSSCILYRPTMMIFSHCFFCQYLMISEWKLWSQSRLDILESLFKWEWYFDITCGFLKFYQLSIIRFLFKGHQQTLFWTVHCQMRGD